MKKGFLIFLILFLFCSPGKNVIVDRHNFYAGSIKEGREIAKMYEWEITKVDTILEGPSIFYLFHYKELELK